MKADVIIIGSGPIGAACARSLAELGFTVLILEAGKIVSSPPGAHLRNQALYQLKPDQFFQEITKWCHQFNKKAPPSQLPGANLTTAYGGQGLLWTNNCPRPPKHEMLSCYTLNEWENLYSQSEAYLQVNNNLFDDSIRQQQLLQSLREPLAKQNRGVVKTPLAARRINDKTINFIATHDILDIPSPHRERITYEVGAEVKQLVVLKDHIKEIHVKLNNHNKILTANHIIVAAGAFQTTQLLYDSNIRPNALGKYLHFHPLTLAQIVLRDEFCAPSRIEDQPPRTSIDPTKEYPWHTMILRDIFPELGTEYVRDNALVDMQVFCPMQVREKNRMILSPHPPRFKVTLSLLDKQTIKKAKEDMTKISNHIGRFRQEAEPKEVDRGFTHPMGMCRLGENPETSVTNFYGQVHGFSNLYLATVGMIPSQMAVNPTLTAMALAIGTTNDIAKKG